MTMPTDSFMVPGPSAFVLSWNTYLNIYASIRGQGEAREGKGEESIDCKPHSTDLFHLTLASRTPDLFLTHCHLIFADVRLAESDHRKVS